MPPPSRLGYTKAKRRSRSARAGLLFPVGKIHRICRKEMMQRNRIAKLAPVYLTAVLEYLVAEVLEQAGILAGLMEKDRVIPKHIRLAITNDEELNKLCPRTIYTGSGGGRDYCNKSRKEPRGNLLEEDDVYTTVLKPTKMRQKSKSSKRKEESHGHAVQSERKESAEDLKEDDDAMTLSDVSDVDNLDDYLEDGKLHIRVKDRSGSKGEVSYFSDGNNNRGDSYKRGKTERFNQFKHY